MNIYKKLQKILFCIVIGVYLYTLIFTESYFEAIVIVFVSVLSYYLMYIKKPLDILIIDNSIKTDDLKLWFGDTNFFYLVKNYDRKIIHIKNLNFKDQYSDVEGSINYIKSERLDGDIYIITNRPNEYKFSIKNKIIYVTI
jgi:hypothetical protein